MSVFSTMTREQIEEVTRVIVREALDESENMRACEQEAHRQGFQDGMATAAARIVAWLRAESKASSDAMDTAKSMKDWIGYAAARNQRDLADAWATKIASGEWLQDEQEAIETLRADQVQAGQCVDVTGDGDYLEVMSTEAGEGGLLSWKHPDGRTVGVNPGDLYRVFTPEVDAKVVISPSSVPPGYSSRRS